MTNRIAEFYDKGKGTALTSVAWRVLGLKDEKRIDELAFSQLASFIIDIAPIGEYKDRIRRILSCERFHEAVEMEYPEEAKE